MQGHLVQKEPRKMECKKKANKSDANYRPPTNCLWQPQHAKRIDEKEISKMYAIFDLEQMISISIIFVK